MVTLLVRAAGTRIFGGSIVDQTWTHKEIQYIQDFVNTFTIYRHATANTTSTP